MKQTLLILLAFVALSATAQKANKMASKSDPHSIYQFSVPSIEGKTINFADFKGKKILVVNTASKCGYTRQYEGLEKLYKENKDNLVIIGFPANNFGQQEPGTDEEIQEFCKARFGVTFPLAKKIEVVGDNTHPLYKWLTSKEKNGVLDATIKWNFNKFLLDENGKMIEYFPSKVEPTGEEISKYLSKKS
jgi:glutathione peroxidase